MTALRLWPFLQNFSTFLIQSNLTSAYSICDVSLICNEYFLVFFNSFLVRLKATKLTLGTTYH